MPNTIQHKRSSTASAVPTGTSLALGELAVNTADGRLFLKKGDGTVVAIGRDASELNTGTVAAARLPAATGSTLGAIIVGTGLGVASGTVSVSYGSTSSTACVGNDARLSDARTPTDGSVTTAKIADGAVTAAKIAASQTLSVASVSATGNISSNAIVSGASLSASTGGVTVSAGAIVIETLGAVTTFRVSSGGIVTSGTWQGATIAVANGGTGATTAADARTNLGLTIGTNVQAYSATLAAVAGGTYTGATSITTLGTISAGTWSAGTIAVARGGTGATDAATALTNLGAAPSANPTITGTLTLSGGQLAFPASVALSANANTLDDYEEGTFTPTYTGSTTNPTVTYASGGQAGYYVKIGRTVFVHVRLALSAKSGGSGDLRISGLPFQSSSLSSGLGNLKSGYSAAWTTNAPDGGYIPNSASYINLTRISGAGSAFITTANLAATSDLIISGHYETDS